MENKDRTPGTDAVCFTAGPQGIPFSAGVIHAWLASDRDAPLVTAGISAGALSAAALVRACQKRAEAQTLPPEAREARRWVWFRQYLDAITNQPLKPIWDAIPDPDDYFADKPPVKDLSVDLLPADIQRTEARSREHYYRLVKLGLWLAGLRVSVGEVATCIVRRVRVKEEYAWWPIQFILLAYGGLIIAGKVLLHLCLSPQFIWQRTERRKISYPRPIFAWAWVIATLLVVDSIYWGLKGVGYVIQWASRWPLLSKFLVWLRLQMDTHAPFSGTLVAWLSSQLILDRWTWVSIAAYAIGLVALLVALIMISMPRRTLSSLAYQLGIHRGLLDSYTLRRKLFELFAEQGTATRVEAGLLLVAAPLQEYQNDFGRQVWFEPDTPVVDALLASLAIPGLFAPVKAKSDWIAGGDGLDLIDGARVRQNPLPALFRWLKKPANAPVAQVLCGQSVNDASIHLVYSVPIRPSASANRRERVDLVEAANIGMDLARRRDSRMEFRQTNFISEMALHIQQAQGTPKGIFPIFADEIAPASEISFPNNLAPERAELLKVAADGCRSTLETLHRNALAGLGYQPVSCARFLSQTATSRSPFIQMFSPGLSEVCDCCSKVLWTLPDPVAEAKAHEQRWFQRIPLEKYVHLAPDNGTPRPPALHRPRIVFLAAGGVFRGAFHIGVIGAMQVAQMKPDLIIGASVGTLMGGAVGAISTLRDDASKQQLLGELWLTFLEVDRRVALTKVLKNAAKQLGTRGRAVDLSPAEMRRAVRKGTRSDPAFAVAGAPSILIDAISTLFLIPHQDTREIAAQFVAGRITHALKLFWQTARNETLQRLEIDTATIGTSLLEERARTLLAAERFDVHHQIDPTKDQPYPDRSLFATASDLSRSQPLLLPRDLDDTTVYDYVQAGLSSSAFPAAFRPRQQAEVQPGLGATDILYADGGMFDNLPFFPAIEVLSVMQRSWREKAQKDSHAYLAERLDAPDLFLAASLESELKKEDDKAPLDTFLAIQQRAGRLSVNTKLNSFLGNADVVAQNAELFRRVAPQPAPKATAEFMDNIVNAAVLKVTPADKDHLNGTFAFAKSVGFTPEKVALSIADGCFQTLRSLIKSDNELASRAVGKLQAAGRIAHLSAIPKPAPEIANGCPYFRHTENMQVFTCPFTQAANGGGGEENETVMLIYRQCTHDPAHATKH